LLAVCTLDDVDIKELRVNLFLGFLRGITTGGTGCRASGRTSCCSCTSAEDNSLDTTTLQERREQGRPVGCHLVVGRRKQSVNLRRGDLGVGRLDLGGELGELVLDLVQSLTFGAQGRPRSGEVVVDDGQPLTSDLALRLARCFR